MAALSPAAETDDPPNFVVIFTDDQGYEDVGVFGAEGFETPHLDRMAAEGLKMNAFYAAAPVCSPSRAALLTGRYPPRAGLTGVLFPRDKNKGLAPEEVTIAEALKRRGYATACFGKWHLGHRSPHLPTEQGFDTYFGIPYSNDMSVDTEMPVAEDVNWRRDGFTLEKFRSHKPKGGDAPLMRDGRIVEYPAKQATLTKRYTNEATSFIESHKDEPFFVYVPHTMPHVPLAASEKFRGQSDRGLYGDVIAEIDWSVGRILKTLRSNGLAEETLVIFTTDNGPWLGKGKAGGSADPLRSGKFSVYEGGMRVPTIAWWPGRIPAGSSSDAVASTIDLLPTLTRLAGLEPPADRVIDGKDIRNLLLHPAAARSPHEHFFYYRGGGGLKAVRSDAWKLHRGKKPELYHLPSDIAEQRNLAGEHPEVVERLDGVAKRFDRQLKDAVQSRQR